MSEASSDKKEEQPKTESTSSSDKKDSKAVALPAGEITETPADYKAFDNQLLDQILHVAGLPELSPLKDSPDRYNIKIDWKEIGEKNGIQQYYTQLPGSSNYVIKGVGIVPAPPQLLQDAIRVQENMKIIDPMCKTTKCIKEWDTDHHIYYASFKMPPLVSARDFVWFCLDTVLSDGTYISTGKSIITKDCPEVQKHVRGEIRASGYVVQAVKDDPKSSRVTYVVQTDPRGWLPTWIVNFVVQSQAYNPGIMKEKVPFFMEQLEKEKAAKSENKSENKDSKADSDKEKQQDKDGGKKAEGDNSSAASANSGAQTVKDDAPKA